MAGRRSLLPLFLACSIFLGLGGWTFHTPSSSPFALAEFIPQLATPTAPTALSKLSAEETLNLANKILADVRWVEVTLWQKVDNDHGQFHIEGKYWQGPDHRFRFDLALATAKTNSQLKVVSDGITLWQTWQIGSNEPEASSWKLSQDTENAANAANQRKHFLAERGLANPLTLLATLRPRWRNLHKEMGVWQGRPVVRLGGVWEPASDPEGLLSVPPRYCFVYLDAETLWPCRLEWHGWARPGDTSQLLLQLEFRDPIVNRPLTPEVAAQVFSAPTN